MTTDNAEAIWQIRLTAATYQALAATGPAGLIIAGEGLRLIWSTAAAVRGDDADAELWWLQLGGAIADTADELDLLPAASQVRLGTGPAPPAELIDGPELRDALADLLVAVRDVLRRYAEQSASGRERLIATLAAGAADRAVTAASP